MEMLNNYRNYRAYREKNLNCKYALRNDKQSKSFIYLLQTVVNSGA